MQNDGLLLIERVEGTPLIRTPPHDTVPSECKILTPEEIAREYPDEQS